MKVVKNLQTKYSQSYRMSEFINLRHYIFINPNNLHGNIHEDPVLIKNKSIHSTYYKNETVRYYSYDDIAELAKNFDIQLYELYCKLNPMYPALLADIGRFLILYYYGGVYHDLKCISTPAMNTFLQEMVKKNVVFIAETHPVRTHTIRNTNIISLCKEHLFLKETLIMIKNKLSELHNTNCKGPGIIVLIGSGIYIDLFKKFQSEVTIREKLQGQYIVISTIIYNSRITSWQKTIVPVFNLQ